jgi:uncharacterized membrane protein HdeD (DUF308 family)
MVILGLFAMMTPAVSGIAVTFMLATLLLIAGIGTVFYAFGSESFGRGALWMFANPGMALATLTLYLAIYFVVDGIFVLIAGFQLEEGKGLVIFNGVVTLLLGEMIWKGWPVSGLWAVGVLVGVKLVVGGMVMMALESAGGSAKKQIGD